MVLEEASRSYEVDDQFPMRATDISEALTNLAYLIRVDAKDPAKVRTYVSVVEERLRVLGRLMHCVAREG